MLELRGPWQSPADKLLDPIVGFGVGHNPYIYIYTLAGRQTRVATFYTAKGRQSGIGPRFFLSGSSKRQRRNPPLSGDCAMPACLPVVL